MRNWEMVLRRCQISVMEIMYNFMVCGKIYFVAWKDMRSETFPANPLTLSDAVLPEVLLEPSFARIYRSLHLQFPLLQGEEGRNIFAKSRMI
jgi:hypothetical protein